MSLLFIDGFDNYGTSVGDAPSPTGVVSRKYPLILNESSFDVVTGRLDAYAVRIVSTGGYFSPGALTTDATMVVGFAFKIDQFPPSDMVFLSLYDGVTLGVNFKLTTAGEIGVYRGVTLLGTTTGASLGVGPWRYIEVKVVCSDTGSVIVRVDEGVKLTLSSVDTKAGSNSYHTTFRFLGTSNNVLTTPHFDDMYCCDGSGSANNDFLGNTRVVAIRPDAAGDSTQLTPSAGANYECVDEELCDDDTTYVESLTVGHKDLYGTDAALTGVILGVQVNTDCRETDASSFDLKTVCKSDTTEDADAGQAIGSTDYVTKTRVLEEDPHTSAAWVAADVNAAQFGLEVA